MKDWNTRWEQFKSDVNNHVSGGEVMIDTSNWLLNEATRITKELDDVQEKRSAPGLLFDEMESLDKQSIILINQLMELARRMELEQARLLDSMKQQIHLENKLKELDSDKFEES